MTGVRATVADGLFEVNGDAAVLIGSRCVGCATLYFPQAASCRNPDCHDKRVERALLPTRGTLYSFTIQRYRPPPLFRMDDWEPYAIGLVDLGEGVQVMGMLSGIAIETIEIGMPLTLIAAPLYADADRGAMLTYKFAPAGGVA